MHLLTSKPKGVAHPMIAVQLAAAGAFMLFLAACSNSGEAAAPLPDLPSKVDAPRPTAKSASPTVKTNERGHLVKKLGDKAGWGDENDAVTWTIDKITVDPPCGEYGEKPASGHTLVLNIRVATGKDPEIAAMLPMLLNSGSFAELSKDGVTQPAEFGLCRAGDDGFRGFPDAYGVNQKYRGQLELVVPEATGTLIHVSAMQNAGGWEWTY